MLAAPQAAMIEARAMLLEHPVDAVIFDLDGVLMDTEHLYTRAAETILGHFGKRYPFELKAQTMGRDPRFGAELLIRTVGLPLTVDEYLQQRSSVLSTLFADCEPIPGAPELVRALFDSAVPLAIATSSSRELCQLKLGRQPWASYFKVVVSSDQVTAFKPAPDIFLRAAELLQVPAERCVVFEDSPAGVQAAVAARMQVIAVPDARHDRSLFGGATRIVDGFAALSPAALGFGSQ